VADLPTLVSLRRGRRCFRRRFISGRLTCPQIPPEMVDAVLAGHALPRAATGGCSAVSRGRGLVMFVGGGCLFPRAGCYRIGGGPKDGGPPPYPRTDTPPSDRPFRD